MRSGKGMPLSRFKRMVIFLVAVMVFGIIAKTTFTLLGVPVGYPAAGNGIGVVQVILREALVPVLIFLVGVAGGLAFWIVSTRRAMINRGPGNSSVEDGNEQRGSPLP